MNILLINQFFHPDAAATAQYLTELALELRRRGHSVTVLAGRQNYHAAGADSLPRAAEWQGIRILRVPATRFGNRTLIGRLLDFLSFYFFAARQASRLSCDTVVCLTTPPFIGWIGARLKRRHGTRFVLWAMDLYPDILVAEGLLSRNGILARLLFRLDRRILECADEIIVPGERIRETVVRKTPEMEQRTTSIPLGPLSHTTPVPRKDNRFLKEHPEYENKLIVMYSGNMGRGHDLQTVLEGHAMADISKSCLLFIGAGKRRSEVADWIARHPDAALLPPQPIESLSDSLSAADVHIVTMRPEYAGLMVPSKFYGILSVGRPTLFVGPEDSEVGQAIRQSGCGFVIPNGQPDRYRSCLETLMRSESLRKEMGEKGRQLALTLYRPDALRKQVADVVSLSPRGRGLG